MGRGRKPTPAAIRIARGARDRSMAGKELALGGGVPVCPEHLDDVARTEWFRIVGELQTMGILASCDMAGIASYCEAYERMVKASDDLKGEPLTVECGENGVKANPLIKIWNDAADQVRRWMAEFGLTPSSRSRVVVPRKVQDALTEFLSTPSKQAAESQTGS